MRWLFALACLGALGFYAADAFSASADSSTRAATATVVADSSAYLAIAKYASGSHAAFVSEDATTGLVTVSFGTASGVTGTGINPEFGYYFHDLLKVTNQGALTVFVQATASASPGSMLACVATTTGAMTRSCYAATTPATALSLAVGSTAYLGLHANATGVAAGSTVTGSVHVYACRTAATSCSSG